ncbi:Glucosamine-6-phosphate deaminase 1 [Candidatus Izimaplasma bacterium HR1]|jgi:glucosamine-6-phosphate deaminase|uniref:glucosamine-6-phosphate deaminase n=1 Tax=Candidatus Izimoplasma sp. HR1 TaxID=1541959 RepID=UPI0004F7F091|nr:Glucosamine-6-phosphate deaminase 1 [Candidatus Izimaplasma bacterium HR1]
MKIILTKDYDELSRTAFKEFDKIVKSEEKPRVGFATGSSPLGLYKEIVNNYSTNKGSYENVDVFNLDEYIGLPENDKNKYSAFLKNNIFNKADFSEENIDLILHNNENIEQECKRYHDILINNPLNLQILGLGANCHIGFNEPGTSFDSVTHIVDLKEETRQSNARFFDSIEEVPTQAITVGIREIMSAENIILVASGQDKADAVHKMLNDEINNTCPASILRVHKSVTVILDEAAASLL